MTDTHLTTNEFVMIEAYYQENLKVSDIDQNRQSTMSSTV